MSAQNILLVIISAVLLFSQGCQPPTEFKEELAVLDSLRTDLSQIKSTIEEYDLKEIMTIDSITRSYSATLDKQINDTLDKDEWMVLGTYVRAINKRLDKFDTKLKKLSTEVDSSLKQIDDLSADLEHNTFDKATVIEYLNAETQKTVELSSVSMKLKEHATKAMEAYHDKHVEVDSLMQRIYRRQQSVEQ